MAETPKFDARLAEGIAYFEQMLAILPDDRTTLEFLVVAYAQQGDKAKEEDVLARLAKVLVEAGDLVALKGLMPRLETADDPHAKAMYLRVMALTAPQPELEPEKPQEKTAEEEIQEIKCHAIEVEMLLVEMLKGEGVLTEAEHKSLHEQLSYPVTDGGIFLISALQILEKENPTESERILAILADKFETPPIPLAAFDPRTDLAKKISSSLMRIRGAVPFAQIGVVTLVAVLNPADADLRSAFTSAFGSCHFYLAQPAAIEKWLSVCFPEETPGGAT